MTANLQEKVTLPDNWHINLREKNGKWQFNIQYYDALSKRRQKWVDTKLILRGNKKKAEAMEQEVLDTWLPILMQEAGLLSQSTTYTQRANVNGRNLDIIGQHATVPISNRILFAEYLKSWLVANEIRYQISTLCEYKRVFDTTIIPFFEPLGLYLDEIKTKHIQDFYNHQMKTVSGNTVLRFHSYLHKTLQDAVNDDEQYPYIQVNPASKTKRPQHQKFIPKVYSKEALSKLFTVIGQDFLFLVVLLDATYGMRRSELMGLKWSAIDFDRKIITVKQAAVRCRIDGEYKTVVKPVLKTKSSFRSFKLTEEIEAVLEIERARQKANRKKYGAAYNSEYMDYIFVDDLGKLRGPQYVSDHFRHILKKNKLEDIRFHDLRHTCATMLLDGGLSLKEIQVYLGHGQLSTTADIYTHLDYSHQQKSSDLASQIIGQIRASIPVAP
ncbi:MAG: site-specific integrase [Clostridiales bacterium]|nr:site-specific integrase [Clostridiales bacterium]